MVKIGIIGGSGLDDPKLISNYEEKDVDTKYGKPSSKITCGNLAGAEVYILARHGTKHDIPPHRVNYRANIEAMKLLGCEYIIAATAVGSLREEIKPGNLVFPNQYIDFTKSRIRSFYDDVGEVVHTPLSEPFNKKLRELLCNACDEFGFDYNKDVTVVTIEGPGFSSKAESNMFRRYGADIINMSSCPEVMLANEAKIPYQSIAMSTDYDCWRENTEPVTFEMIMKTMSENAEKVKKLLFRGIEKIVSNDTENKIFSVSPNSTNKQEFVDEDFIKSKIRTIPDFPKQGIMFRDVTTLIGDKEGFERTINNFYNRYKERKIDVVAGIESRGFIFGSALANKLNVGFVPIRKPGKLPYEKISQEYQTEYSLDKIEMHKDAVKNGERVLLCDDLLATGGTLCAACNLIEKSGGVVEECAVVVDLPALKGKDKLKKWKVYSIVEFEGE